ncbi:MAG: hypothetical protein C5B51_03310 [Terriglobia bacterium]|nr:MAG: hypothetical protein C5B51_03310 [Terriglobia bacterium]
MKPILALTVLLLAATWMTGAGGPQGVAYIGHDKVAESLAKGGNIITAPDYTVLGSHRDKAGQVEVHEKETDIFYVVDGAATFITGGTMIGGKQTKAGQMVGTDIHGGESHRLAKGDVMVIPAGVPHWFKEVPQSISYYVVKVIKP